MENTVEKDFFILLKSGLWETSCEGLSDTFDIKNIAHLAQSHTVLALVASRLVANDFPLPVPDSLRQRLKMQIFSTVALNDKMNSVLLSVSGKLKEERVDFVLLKGQGLSFCYPHPELRQCGDIDILVRESDFDRTASVLATLDGYKEELCDIDKHKTVIISGIAIEIHKSAMKFPGKRQNRIYAQFEKEAFGQENLPVLKQDGTEIQLFPPEFNAFYIFTHIYSHFFISGIGLRQFCDWAMFLHRNHAALDSSRLKCILEDMGLMLPWQIFGAILVLHLGLPEDEFPFYDAHKAGKAERVLRIVLEGGNFGNDFNTTDRPSGYIASKLYSVAHYFKVFYRIQRIMPVIGLKYLFHTLSSGIRLLVKDIRKK